MNGFCEMAEKLIRNAGVADCCVFCSKTLELPGYFRPTKKWDVLVVVDGQLLAVMEMKSQVGPSFGNNFNNRAEEAIGSATDLWTAYREGAFAQSPRPWLGYLFLLEDCPESNRPVKVDEPHFNVFKEFKDASYAARYELLCRKLIRERLYDAAAFIMSESMAGVSGVYKEPAGDLGFGSWAASLVAHVSAFSAVRRGK